MFVRIVNHYTLKRKNIASFEAIFEKNKNEKSDR